MPDPERPYAHPMAWWGVVQAAVEEGATTAQMFERIRARADELGVSLPPGGAVAYNTIRSMAAELRNASARLGKAPDTAALTSRELAPLPYTGPATGPAAPRMFHVRVNYAGIKNGEPISDYVTLEYPGGLPPTVGQLREEAAIITEDLVNAYGSALTAISSIQVGELGR